MCVFPVLSFALSLFRHTELLRIGQQRLCSFARALSLFAGLAASRLRFGARRSSSSVRPDCLVWTAVGLCNASGVSRQPHLPWRHHCLVRAWFSSRLACAYRCTVAPVDTRPRPFCSSYCCCNHCIATLALHLGCRLDRNLAPGFATGVSSCRFGGGPSGPFLAPFTFRQRRCHAAAVLCGLRRRTGGIRNRCRLFLRVVHVPLRSGS